MSPIDKLPTDKNLKLKDMKRFTETAIGITTIAVLPAIITYILFADFLKHIDFNLMDFITQHQPFVISVTVFAVIMTILFIRKWILDKFADYRQKLSALKTFRDQEQVCFADHVNAQIKQLDDRLSVIDKVEYREPNPADFKNAAESKRLKDTEINAYNSAFKDWGLGNYGHVDQTTLYKTNDYKTD